MHRLRNRWCGLMAGVALGALLLPALTGCVTAGRVASTEVAYGADAEAPGAVEARLRAAERSWRGTPYRYGGATRDGIDCSAFVQALYRDVFGLALPRATAAQVREGARVPHGGWQAGDLVFFRPPGKTRHVGIYLGRGEFAHAATSEGVTVSRLDDAYWTAAYWTARRLLSDAVPAAAVRPAPRPDRPARRATARTGW